MTVIMKGTLVVLVLLQLVVLNEALTKKKSKYLGKILPRRKLQLPTCPKNPRLEEFKTALRLAAEHSRRKRSLTFPMNCLHAAVIETDEGDQNHFGIYECCEKCRDSFDICILGSPLNDMICESRAYKCLCECREKELKSGTEFALRKSTESRASTKLVRNEVCKKKKCKRHQCCVEHVCLKLKVPKT